MSAIKKEKGKVFAILSAFCYLATAILQVYLFIQYDYFSKLSSYSFLASCIIFAPLFLSIAMTVFLFLRNKTALTITLVLNLCYVIIYYLELHALNYLDYRYLLNNYTLYFMLIALNFALFNHPFAKKSALIALIVNGFREVQIVYQAYINLSAFLANEIEIGTAIVSYVSSFVSLAGGIFLCLWLLKSCEKVKKK